jgi:regulatory protein
MSEEAEGLEETTPAGPLSGRVTAIELQARDPQRLNLFLESRFAFGLSAAVVAASGLQVGMVLSATDVAGLLRREAGEQAMQQAYVYLSYRARSEHELRRSLGQKGHPPETIEAVIDRLRTLHYLDDGAFAASWVEGRQRYRPRGARLLRAELRQKGVDPETAERAVDDAVGDERALARDAGAKKAATMDTADYGEFGRRVGGFLLRRGFASDVVWEVVRELWAVRTGEVAPPAE